ncbi:MAG: TetR family transcriptional regulator [Polyangiaceae bacterium]|nr:TetR family transcriptional regulator [Polyangiaceae bacterium]
MGKHQREETRTRILDGALEAIGRGGIRRLDMVEISRRAGVSRDTLYRYFPNRAAVLQAMGLREGMRAYQMAQAAIDDREDGYAFETILRHCNSYIRNHNVLTQLLAEEPGFVLSAVQGMYGYITQTMAPALHDEVARLPIVKEGLVSSQDVMDWQIRILISAFLFPDPDPDRMPNQFAKILARSLAEEEASTSSPPAKKKTARTAPKKTPTAKKASAGKKTSRAAANSDAKKSDKKTARARKPRAAAKKAKRSKSAAASADASKSSDRPSRAKKKSAAKKPAKSA